VAQKSQLTFAGSVLYYTHLNNASKEQQMTDKNWGYFDDSVDFFEMFAADELVEVETEGRWIGMERNADGSLTVVAEYVYDVDEDGQLWASGRGYWL
jgi:hypothetical protein